ncbi:hypothetical protein ACROYT_G005370 [Oculina patagonica]
MSGKEDDPSFVPQTDSGSSSDEKASPLQKAKRRRVTTGNDGLNNPEVYPSLTVANLEPASSFDLAPDNDGQSNSEVSLFFTAGKKKPARTRTTRPRPKTKDAENDGKTTLGVSPSLPASLTPARPGQNAEELKMMAQQHQSRPRNEATREGQRKDLKLKWCTFGECKTVTAYLRSHLTKAHKMKPGALLENSLHVVRDYCGVKEADMLQKPSTSSRSSSTSSRPSVTSTVTSTSASVIPRTISSTPCVVTSTVTSVSASATRCTPSSATTTRCSASTRPPPPLAPSDSDSENSADPYYGPRESSISYFTSPVPSTDRQRWLVGFYRYLNTPDCGRRRAKNRL